jgi:hypothetical protein
MSLGRRTVTIDDPSRWVFNRMAEVYDARPPYPVALVDALAELAGPAGSRVADLGAGIGHLSLPLAARGFLVVAVEPAVAMLDRLRAAAAGGPALRAVHATVTGHELARVLAPGGALAIVTCEPTPTPFMRAVVKIIEEAVPRRPRDLTRAMTHVSSLIGVPLADARRFEDETPIDHPTLDRILRSISFVGPAMNPTRFAAFRARIHALPEPPIWARTFVLRSGRRPTRRDGKPHPRSI